MNRIFLFFISCFFCCSSLIAQQEQEQEQETKKRDSIFYKERYGLMLGTDLYKLSRNFYDDDYTGFEINGDFRFTKKLWFSGEIGFEETSFEEVYIDNSTSGSYIKLGGIYNFYDNWLGMDNILFGGFRVGFSTFSQDLNSYRITVRDNYFEPDIREISRSFSNLNAVWTEFQGGIRVEVLKNLFLGAHVQLKVMVSQSELSNFENLYVPGFNRTYTDSRIGAGFGYSIRYLIPIFSKQRAQAVDY
ncbi:hypothetical protein GCM10010832_08040 [Psychroflexus planctonicus]|uniref:Outer membrane protein beta-barrel domain-containing protein n=2 Tax=Psychroflexus planctonicus TaxID=1526575 RepID=A0ABQ1SGI6_9FLAO|nr:hypothetical protein GCM10010832_08040 [Psychroflexus planctonicus]